MTPKDRLGRERRESQDAALEAINKQRKHGEGVTSKSHNIAAHKWAHEKFQTLTARQRGELIEMALWVDKYVGLEDIVADQEKQEAE